MEVVCYNRSMFEVPKRLINKWERRLKKAGMPEELEPTKIPLVPLSNREALLAIAPDLREPYFNEFLTLEEKFQRDIISDLSAKKRNGMNELNIMVRLILLVKYAHYL